MMNGNDESRRQTPSGRGTFSVPPKANLGSKNLGSILVGQRYSVHITNTSADSSLEDNGFVV